MGEDELARGNRGDSLKTLGGREKGKREGVRVDVLKKSSGKRVDRGGKADKLVAAILSVL